MKKEIVFNIPDEKKYDDIQRYLDEKDDIEKTFSSTIGAIYSIGKKESILMINIDNSRTITITKINPKIYKDLSRMINKEI